MTRRRPVRPPRLVLPFLPRAQPKPPSVPARQPHATTGHRHGSLSQSIATTCRVPSGLRRLGRWDRLGLVPNSPFADLAPIFPLLPDPPSSSRTTPVAHLCSTSSPSSSLPTPAPPLSAYYIAYGPYGCRRQRQTTETSRRVLYQLLFAGLACGTVWNILRCFREYSLTILAWRSLSQKLGAGRAEWRRKIAEG